MSNAYKFSKDGRNNQKERNINDDKNFHTKPQKRSINIAILHSFTN